MKTPTQIQQEMLQAEFWRGALWGGVGMMLCVAAPLALILAARFL
jgi:hypothetical protein